MPPVFKYPMKMKSFGLNETNLLHVHGIFKKNEIELTKRTPHPFIDMNLFSRNTGSTPCTPHGFHRSADIVLGELGRIFTKKITRIHLITKTIFQ